MEKKESNSSGDDGSKKREKEKRLSRWLQYTKNPEEVKNFLDELKKKEEEKKSREDPSCLIL